MQSFTDFFGDFFITISPWDIGSFRTTFLFVFFIFLLFLWDRLAAL